jgi:hypothetical protein
MFLNKSGDVIVCGANPHYAFGIGKMDYAYNFTIVPGLPPIKRICRQYTKAISALIDENGCVWVCGHNKNGELSLRHSEETTRFERVPDVDKAINIIIVNTGIYIHTEYNTVIHSGKVVANCIVEIKFCNTLLLFLSDCGNVYSFADNSGKLYKIPGLCGISRLSEAYKLQMQFGKRIASRCIEYCCEKNK